MSDSVIENAVNEAGTINGTKASEAKDSMRMVFFSEIRFDRGRNPRKAKRYTPEALSSLIRSILEHGLQEPPVVSERADGTLWLLKGHRRMACLEIVRTQGLPKDKYGPALAADPSFAAKVKCRVLKGLTIQGEMDLVMDHGGDAANLGLDKAEKLLTAKILTRFGFSHDFIASKIGGSRSNYSNGIARVLAMPSVVEEMYLSEEDGAINISQEVLKVLYPAYEKDQKQPGSRLKVAGPNFTAAWEELLANGPAAVVKTIPRKDLIGVAGVESDDDIRDLLQAIANGDKEGLGTSIERLHHRLMPVGDTVGTGLTRYEEGIVSTVGDFHHVV